MVAGITILAIEFILLCASAFGYIYPVVAWCVLAGMAVCAILGGIILPFGIKGIKTRTPSRGKAIATTAMAGVAIIIGVTTALSMAFSLAYLSYFAEWMEEIFQQMH